MKSFYLLVLAVALSVASCRTKEGEPGPAGQSALKQQGQISGTIAFVNAAGHDTSVTFSYSYFESLNDNKFFFQQNASNTYYEFDFQRRDLQDNNCFINLNGYGYGTNNNEDDPSYAYMNFSFLKVIDGVLYDFSNYDYVTVTNVNLDPATGRLTYDYTAAVNYGSSSQGTITGSVDVTLNRGGSSPK